MEMVFTGLIIILISAYFIYVVVRQVKKAKNGNYCGSCSGCVHKDECGKSDK